MYLEQSILEVSSKSSLHDMNREGTPSMDNCKC